MELERILNAMKDQFPEDELITDGEVELKEIEQIKPPRVYIWPELKHYTLHISNERFKTQMSFGIYNKDMPVYREQLKTWNVDALTMAVSDAM